MASFGHRFAFLTLVAACGGLPAGESETSTGAGTDTDTDTDTDTGDPAGLCAPITIPVLESPGAQKLELIANRKMIPGIADQPTTHGQILGTLFAFDGRLHLGYGDYSANTGPIAMYAWDPQESNFVDLGSLPTEEILWFRPAAGGLYSPAIDPDTHQGIGGVYRLECGADEWTIGTAIDGAVHVYDIAAQGDRIYAGTGSLTGKPALLMASDDFGESWTEVLRRESAADEFSRFYFVGATPELLFVSGKYSFAALRHGNAEFEILADPPSGSLVPIVLGEAMVITSFSGNPGRGKYQSSYRISGQVFVDDTPWPKLAGDEAELIAWGPDSDPERLLVMMAAKDGSTISIQRTDDLREGAMAWQELAAFAPLDPQTGDTFVSMALLNNDLYLGTHLGSLYALRELEKPAT
ncbi:MAG TPA: hypothetical protein ENJ18_12650 [Nannocystis exedens]|nr:hypothetical protein [Nannocystis exedens]